MNWIKTCNECWINLEKYSRIYIDEINSCYYVIAESNYYQDEKGNFYCDEIEIFDDEKIAIEFLDQFVKGMNRYNEK